MISQPAQIEAAQVNPLSGLQRTRLDIDKSLRVVSDFAETLGAPDALERARARELVRESLWFLRTAIVAHHTDEEKSLFPRLVAASPHDRC